MKRCLIVIDMLRDFLEEGGALFCGERSREIIAPVAKRLAEAREKGWPVIYTCDTHDPNDAEFEMYPPHAVGYTEGAEIIAEVAPKPGDHIVPKTRFSAFHDTDLDRVLDSLDVDEVEILGVCTSICVMFTAEDLRNRDYRTLVRRDCVADFDPQAHEFALKHMARTLGVSVVGEG